jgi:hypothetical protein
MGGAAMTYTLLDTLNDLYEVQRKTVKEMPQTGEDAREVLDRLDILIDDIEVVVGNENADEERACDNGGMPPNEVASRGMS